MRTAISIPPFTDTATLVEMATEAEEAGWDGVFLWDHMHWDRRLGLDVHDPWVLLGAMAARTERVRLGTLVTPLARRRPWVVAKHLTTLDHLSGGRAVLGVGLGEPGQDDFGTFGDPGERKEQAAVVDDALVLLDGLLRGPVKHQSDRFHVEAELRPRPVQSPRPPIWVAAVAPYRAPLKRAVRWDGVATLGMPQGYLTPSELATYLEGVDQPASWDVVVPWAPGVTDVSEYTDAGATWLIDGTWPEGDWVTEFRDRIRRGPGL